MNLSKNQIFLLFLNEGEPMSRPSLKYKAEKVFGKNEGYQFLYPALSDLLKFDILGEYDLESSGAIDGASASHKTHGEIDMFEVTDYSGLDELITMSWQGPAFAMENVGALTKEAAECGLGRALSALTTMPIDSTAWTGLPKGFVFTETTKRQLVQLLGDAESALSRSGLTNSEIGQGQGLLRASLILLEVPDPPKSDIWSLIQKGSAITSLSTFFASAIAFILKN